MENQRMSKQQFSLHKPTLLSRLPLIAQQYASAPVKDLRYLGGGTYGRAFLACFADNSSFVLKAYCVQGMQEEEAYQLRLLSKNTRVPMPRVLFTHCDETTAVLGMSFIPGRAALDPRFMCKNRRAREAFAKDVALGLLDLHSVQGEKYGDLHQATHTNWRTYYQETIEIPILTGLERLVREKKFDANKYELLCKGSQQVAKISAEPESSVLIHGDLSIANIMADPKTMELTGFIDPTGTMWADREYDLFQLQNMWGNHYGLYDAYKANRTMEKHCDLRVAYYGALNEAACYLRVGKEYKMWQWLWNRRLRNQLKL
jgi:fructosamine-3-kinase